MLQDTTEVVTASKDRPVDVARRISFFNSSLRLSE